MADEKLGIVSSDVDSRAVRRLLNSRGRRQAEGGREFVEEFNDRPGRVVRHGCSTAPSEYEQNPVIGHLAGRYRVIENRSVKESTPRRSPTGFSETGTSRPIARPSA